ncbi:MAG TPA: VOC family protein, partial [Xanthobacteraceae bacterium]|nr:VOC family protein [Xanthobacteraceae bacterium]
MSVQSLGYVGIRAKSLDDWSDYGVKLLGLQRVDRSASSLAFRMDDRKQRIIVDQDGGAGVGFFGWEVADAAALDALAAKLEAAGVKVARGARALADERRVKDLIVLADPLGNRVELFHGAETAAEPFKPGRSISGFRTGALGMGHVVLSVENADTVMPFYRDLLGFKLSDYYHKPFSAYFMHVNPRHHSLAFIQSGKNAVHHMMMELFNFDDVGQGYDIAQSQDDRVAVTLGRHTSDYLTSFYSWTPSEFMVEYGWGGRLIQPETWKPYERSEGPSMWGHDRGWLPPAQREAAQRKTRELAASGYRAPVQVMEGNYGLMPGTCPWWDS